MTANMGSNMIDNRMTTYTAFANPINPLQIIVMNENNVTVICTLYNLR
jgi:hypothetical protein